MGFWFTLALWVSSFVLGELLKSKTSLPQKKPGRFTPPTAEEGEVLPVIFGTCKVPINVIFSGTAVVDPVTRRVRTSLFTKTTQTVRARILRSSASEHRIA